MRSVVLAALALTGCFCDSPSRGEWVRVRVPVYTGPAEVSVVGQARTPATHDPCDKPTPDISTCHPVAYVRASALESEPNCYYDTKVKSGEVGRILECPDNSALVVFDGATFVGETSGGYINACKTTTYDFPEGDRCTWRTEQRIEGSLERGLAYAYSESPVAGHACTLACRARTDLGLVRTE